MPALGAMPAHAEYQLGGPECEWKEIGLWNELDGVWCS